MKPGTSPWLSIVLPTYNGGAYLGSTLASIESQNEPEIECLAIDGGSTDATLSILERFSSRIPLRIISAGPDRGWVHSTNQGLLHAKGRYICFLHQDDLWKEKRLSIMRDLSLQYLQAGLIFTPSLFIGTKGETLGMLKCPFSNKLQEIDSQSLIKKLIIQSFFAVNGFIFKREILETIGPMDTNWLYSADWDFELKLAAAASAVYYPKPLSAFRIHPYSQTLSITRQILDYERQQEGVLSRHAPVLMDSKNKQGILAAARFSILTNVTLARLFHRVDVDLGKFFQAFLRLGPLGWFRYFYCSRILDRVMARLKLLLTLKR